MLKSDINLKYNCSLLTLDHVSVMTKMLRLYKFPSFAVESEHRKCHAIRAHKPQAISDWLNPLSLGTMSASAYIENLA